MKTLLKNMRSYQKRLGSANQADEVIVMSDREELESDNDEEGSDGGGEGDGEEEDDGDATPNGLAMNLLILHDILWISYKDL